ncbi:MAG: hypothetical protein RLZZ192_828 [Pseudomonadota bacterium]|jgi:signal transduction histidine kinase
MPFDPFVAIIIMYCSVLCGTMTVLFWAFKDAFNPSGRLFLLSEALRLPSLIALALVHINQDFMGGVTVLFVGPFYTVSEICFVGSLHALSRNKIHKHFLKMLLPVFLLSFVLETMRVDYPNLQKTIYMTILGAVSATAVWSCARSNDQALRNAPFWRMLKYVEGIFLGLSLMRLTLIAFGILIAPTQTGSQNVAFVSILLTLLIFRSFCYQSIWMTWSSPNAQVNRFNENLIKSLHERNLLLQNLATLNRRIGVSALASSLAHQLSQPLTGAALQAEAVKQKLGGRPDDATVLQGVEKIADILGNLSDVVRNLRSLFKSQEDSYEEIALEPLCKDVIRLAEFSEAAHGITIQTQGQIKSRLLGNPIQIQQIVINLIDNAIQASRDSKNKMIEITFADSGSRVSLSVRDHGAGFTTEALGNLFNLYASTKENGTGLGLWLSRQIAERHKGEISAFNHAKGGAVVYVEFPTMGSAA